ncbi:MAG: DUF302 domain-containing protein [Sandaracinaceae bacterium]
MTDFGMEKRLDVGFDEALRRVPDALKAEGFGVLTEVDVQATLKQKIDVDFRRYRILGACNPPFAHQALSEDIAVGLMMPCNVVVYEDDDERAVVLAVDPRRTVAITGNPKLAELADTIADKLRAALERM